VIAMQIKHDEIRKKNTLQRNQVIAPTDPFEFRKSTRLLPAT
jgi:hypothetical protein